MAKYKIVISDYYYPDIHEELEEFRRLGDDVEVVDCTKIRPGGIKDPTELLTYAHDCDALITQFAAPIDAAFMDGLEKCRDRTGHGGSRRGEKARHYGGKLYGLLLG